MLYYDRIDVSEGVDINKTSALRKCNICHYWYFLNYSLMFQPNVCNRCHNLLMMSINLRDNAILFFYCHNKGSNYRCIISLISKIEAIKLLQNADLTEKRNIVIDNILTFSNIEVEKKMLPSKGSSFFERCRYLKIISI